MSKRLPAQLMADTSCYFLLPIIMYNIFHTFHEHVLETALYTADFVRLRNVCIIIIIMVTLCNRADHYIFAL